MNPTSDAKRRKRRSKKEIHRILQEYEGCNQSIEDYCKKQNIPSNTFYNWRKKYGTGALGGFTKVLVTVPSQGNLFAEVGKIRLYQPVSAAYLKELGS
ncbi:MAG TPA: transposase [Chitinophaga sp.]|uniref:IS66 family insertion sequence element accessory protein TnpA n=1 Tax=Chitinophaga sp. TaxID=1869181 RepID=UPI002C2368CE|nr:transposase [Chitinophaga sp.]HVI44813.1 transposase [Chitinophaga sp.]